MIEGNRLPALACIVIGCILMVVSFTPFSGKLKELDRQLDDYLAQGAIWAAVLLAVGAAWLFASIFISVLEDTAQQAMDFIMEKYQELLKFPLIYLAAIVLSAFLEGEIFISRISFFLIVLGTFDFLTIKK